MSTSTSSDKLAFDVGLQEQSEGEACWWTLLPSSKQRSEGEKVRVGDDAILVSVATERYLVRKAISFILDSKGDDDAFHIFCSKLLKKMIKALSMHHFMSHIGLFHPMEQDCPGLRMFLVSLVEMLFDSYMLVMNV